MQDLERLNMAEGNMELKKPIIMPDVLKVILRRIGRTGMKGLRLVQK
jgi:hypothetical protein